MDRSGLVLSVAIVLLAQMVLILVELGRGWLARGQLAREGQADHWLVGPHDAVEESYHLVRLLRTIAEEDRREGSAWVRLHGDATYTALSETTRSLSRVTVLAERLTHPEDRGATRAYAYALDTVFDGVFDDEVWHQVGEAQQRASVALSVQTRLLGSPEAPVCPWLIGAVVLAVTVAAAAVLITTEVRSLIGLWL